MPKNDKPKCNLCDDTGWFEDPQHGHAFRYSRGCKDEWFRPKDTTVTIDHLDKSCLHCFCKEVWVNNIKHRQCCNCSMKQAYPTQAYTI